MKKILRLLSVVSLTAVAASSVVACSENSVFKTINNWSYQNGEVMSLVNDNGTIYAGTKTADGKGKLYKINSADGINEETGWTDTNGEVMSLVNDNGTIYIGTEDGKDRGQLYKKIMDI